MQKWTLKTATGIWSLDYDLVNGLGLVNNANASLPGDTVSTPGVTGLFGLTAEMVGGSVELFATSYGLNELSPSYLYEITDDLSATTEGQVTGESFNTLYSAPAGTSIRGVAFSPIPEPASFGLLVVGLAGLRHVRARRRGVARV